MSTRVQRLKQAMPALILGLVAWTIAIVPLLVFNGTANSHSRLVRSVGAPALAGGVILALVLWICSIIGWDSFPIGGGGGTQLKMIATVIIGFSLVGMVFIAYWTGKCLFRWRDKLRDAF